MTSEVQTIAIIGNPDSGSFALALDGQPTSFITNHPSAGDLERALELLPNIGLNNIAITKDSSWVYRATFQNALANQNINQLQLITNNLAPIGCDVEIATIQDGTDSTGDPKQDAINDAYSTLVYFSRRHAMPYPFTGKALTVVLEQLRPYQTVE
jgi:hypothetical protein